MSDERNQQNQYTYDEMISRLQEGKGKTTVQGEEREVDSESGKVTVRRRKRRRTNSGKARIAVRDASWKRIVRKGAFIGVPVIVALLVVLYAVLAASVGGDGFQQGVGASLGTQMGLEAPVTISDTRLHGVSLAVARAEGRGKDGAMIREFVVEGSDLKMDPSSFLGGLWDVSFCTIRRGNVRLVAPTAPATVAHAGSSPLLRAAGFLLSNKPESILFQEVAVWEGNMLFGVGDDEKLPGIRKVRCDFSRREEGGHLFYDGQLSGNSSTTLDLEGWPTFRLDSVRLQISSEEAEVLRSRFTLQSDAVEDLEKAGTIRARGSIPTIADSKAELMLEVEQLSLASILPRGMERFVQGLLESKQLQLTWDTSRPVETRKMMGPVSIRVCQLRGFGLVSALEKLTAGELQGLDLDECQFNLEMGQEGVFLRDIQATALAKVQVLGDLKIDPSGQLDGKMRVGLSPELLLGRIPPMLALGDGGYYWTEVKIGGLTTAPVDDLSGRIMIWKAEGASSGEGVQPGRPGAGESMGLLPTDPTDDSVSGRKEDDRWEGLFRSLTEEEKKKDGEQP